MTDGWVKVEDRLPKTGEQVLIAWGQPGAWSPNFGVAYYRKKRWNDPHDDRGYQFRTPSYWHPIAPPGATSSQTQPRQPAPDMRAMVEEVLREKFGTAQEQAPVAEAPEIELTLRRALDIARDAIAENHQWHKDHDDYDGYPESDIEEHNLAALSCVDAALRSSARKSADEGQAVATSDELKRLTDAAHKARMEACSAWSNIMAGPQAPLPSDFDARCEKAHAAEEALRTAIDSLAALTITAEQWHEYQELKRKAEEYDKRTGQPDCVKPEVAEWEARMEEFLVKRGLLAKAEPGDATA